MRRLTTAGSIAALALGASVLAASAQQTGTPAPFWPATTGMPVVTEWYSDIPWHQKLGTFAGNEIDEALVLPYAALGANEQVFCAANKLSQPACMIEAGINNILGILRTDTPYNPTDSKIKAAQECENNSLPCIEVKLGLSSFWTRSTGAAIALQPRPFGTEPPNPGVSGQPGRAIPECRPNREPLLQQQDNELLRR